MLIGNSDFIRRDGRHFSGGGSNSGPGSGIRACVRRLIRRSQSSLKILIFFGHLHLFGLLLRFTTLSLTSLSSSLAAGHRAPTLLNLHTSLPKGLTHLSRPLHCISGFRLLFGVVIETRNVERSSGSSFGTDSWSLGSSTNRIGLCLS